MEKVVKSALDIPEAMMRRIDEEFERMPEVRSMRMDYGVLVRNNRYREALELSKKIDEIRSSVIREYLQSCSATIERGEVSTKDLSRDDKDKMMELLLVCFMCADMLETSVMDMDSILHRYSKGTRISMFDDIRDLSKMCRMKLRYLGKSSDYLDSVSWGDKCDGMYELLCNKARSLYRKHEELKKK